MNFRKDFLRRRGWAIGVLALLVWGSMAAMLAIRPAHPRWSMVLTLIASTGYLVMAAAGGGHRSWYGRLIGLGLAGCWVGDMAGPYHFNAGAVAFLLGHLAFSAAFCVQGLGQGRLLAGLLVLPASLGLGAWVLPHVPLPDQKLVLAYLSMISVMVVLAFGASGAQGGRTALIGALLFYVSDIFVARWRYVSHGAENAFICYPIYYTACMTLAASLWMRARGDADQPETSGDGRDADTLST